MLSPLAWASWRAGLQPLHPSWLTLADKAPLLNTDKIHRELGWNPAYDAPEALDEVLRGLRAGIGTDS